MGRLAGPRTSPVSRGRPPGGRESAGGDGPFRRIWAIVARIPRGRVATYGQIARQAGMPRGGRTVGWAMASLPDGAVVAGVPVPWHRVVGAGGISLAGDGALEQAARLRLEGVTVSRAGRIRLDRFQWWPAAAPRPPGPGGRAALRRRARRAG